MISEVARKASGSARPRRWPWWLVGGVLLALGAAAVGWAAATVLTPAEDPLEASSFTYVTVQPGAVESSIKLNTVAAWTPVLVGANRAVGVVTEVTVQPGGEIGQGSMLFRVDQRPVVVAQGNVPAYRPIEWGAEGVDVSQLQQMLADLGHYSDAVDGEADGRTVAAIRAWQSSLGVERTGVVEVADVVFVPQLPTRVSLDTEVISRGRLVSGGEQVVRALPPSPEFRVPVTEAQAGMMPAGTRVEIVSPEGAQWMGLAGEQVVDAQSGTINVRLGSAEGETICGDECGQVPVTGDVRLASSVVTVEQVSGLVVPSAALVAGADGLVAVIDADGERIPVTVIASARGMSVVEGLEEGARVRVPAAEEAG